MVASVGYLKVTWASDRVVRVQALAVVTVLYYPKLGLFPSGLGLFKGL